MTNQSNRYSAIIEDIFSGKFAPGARAVDFEREDLIKSARRLGIKLPSNIGDVIYSFRYRQPLPDAVQRTAPEGSGWIIRGIGSSKYRFVLAPSPLIEPNANLAETKIPDATPGVVARYALTDEQALLAKLRYNRLVDVFTRVTCYSLQNHLRTSVSGIGQVETDELYVGVDKRGAHYVIPVQAKGGKDKLSVVQIEQDFALCKSKFPALICRPVAARFMPEDVIALFEFEESPAAPKIVSEKHYRLVPARQVSDKDLAAYRKRPVA